MRARVPDPLAAKLVIPEDVHWESWLAPTTTAFPGIALEFQGKLLLANAGLAGSACCGSICAFDGTGFEFLPRTGGVRELGVWQGQLVAATVTTGPSTEILLLGGTEWDTLGVANDQVEFLAEWDGQLVVGGRFTSVSGQSFEKIARWDGVGWAGFAGGFPGAGVRVLDLTVHQGGLLATVGNSVRAWDANGGAWGSLGPDFNSTPTTVSDGTDLYASGGFTLSGAATVRNLARWDGASWQEVPGGLGSRGATVWSGGIALVRTSSPSRVANFDGVVVTQLPDSIGFGVAGNNSITRLTPWGTKLVVSGAFVNNGSSIAAGILTWDGTTFGSVQQPWDDRMRSPTLGGISDLSVWGGNLLAAGKLSMTADLDHLVLTRRVAAWDGAHWQGLGAGFQSPFSTLLGEWNGQPVAAGFDTGPLVGSSTGVVRWDGANWVGVGSVGGVAPLALGSFQGELLLGDQASQPGLQGVARWTGSSWEPLGGGVSLGGFAGWGAALLASGDTLVVGGWFDHAGGVPASNVAAWDGLSWRSLGAGFDDVVDALVEWNGGIVAGGSFTSSGGQPMAGAAFWDGGTWMPLGTNVVSVVSLRTANGALFASGTFRLPDLSEVTTIARWTGSEWHLLGSGPVEGPFEIFDGYLYCAGLGLVHGQVTHGLARLPLDLALGVAEGPPVASGVALSASPNPTRGATHLDFTLAAPGVARLTVHDVTGRRVSTLLDGPLPAGTHRVAWAAPARPGVYFATLELPGGTRRAVRFVRL